MSGNGDMSPLTNITYVAAGGSHTCALNDIGSIYCWGEGSDGALADDDVSTHDVDYPAFAQTVGGSGILNVGTFERSYYQTSDGLEIEKARISTLGTYPHRVTPFDADNSQYTFYSDSKCENEIGSLNSNSAFDLPNDVERIYFKKGNLGCSASYFTYGFDRIPPTSIPISLISSVTVESDQSIPFEVKGFEEGDRFVAFSDAHCTDSLTEQIVTMTPTQEGIVPAQPSDFTLYGKFYDTSGNPGRCERLQEVTVLNQRTDSVLGVICKNDGNGMETCNPLPPSPTFASDQLDEDGEDSIFLDLDSSETISDLLFYSDQNCKRYLTHTNNANPAIISNLPLGETHIYFKRGARSLCYDSNLTYRRVLQFFHTRQKVSAGKNHNCAVTDVGGVLCWGQGIYGALGNNATDNKDHPVSVKSVDGTSTLDDILEVSAGSANACALNTSGKVLCWGFGTNGQLGNDKGDQTNKLPSYVVDGDGSSTHLTGIVQLAIGASHSCALKTDGGVLCWGNGSNGQLGNYASGNTNNKDHPVPVKSVDGASNLGGITYISVGRHFTCALNYTQNIYCWGINGKGQLGNNTTTDSSLPVLVVDGDSSTVPLSDIIQVTNGKDQTCALNGSGRVLCWGYGVSGQLGNGQSVSTNYPVLVNRRSK